MEYDKLPLYNKQEEESILENIYYKQLFNNSPQGIVVLNQDDAIIMANEAFCILFHYTLDELLGKNLDHLIVPDNLYTEARNITLNASRGAFIKKNVLRKTKKNVLKHFSVVAYPIMFENQQIGTYAIYDDITEKKHYEEKLKLFANVLEHNTEGVFITDQDHKIKWINKAFTTITGYQFKDVKDKDIGFFQTHLHPESFYQNILDCIKRQGYWKGELWSEDKYSKVYPVKINFFSIKNGENLTNIVAIIADITKKRKKEEEIYKLAYRDTLTGLYNRESFNSIFKESIQSSYENKSKMALLFLDLDGFKKINDNLGHSMGDNLLRVIANNLQFTLGEKTKISRIGGDEFTVIIDQYQDIDEVIKIITKVTDSFASPWIFDNYSFYLSTSIGVSLYPEHGKDSNSLIYKADLAMYHAKENKHNTQYMIYTPSMSEKTQKEYLIENNLQSALFKEELSIHYQPIVDLESNNIIGAEALLRWNNKEELGIVSPDVFIPIAEKCGLIIPMGEWVLRKACQQSIKWKEQGFPPLFVSVNVSITQLQQQDFSRKLSTILEEVGMDAENLILEITENFFIHDIKSMLPHLDALSALGIKISIDNFGTGLSCISKLIKLNIESLKIDRSFIRNPYKDPDNARIVAAIITLAKCFNFKVIAEGVDTEQQLQLLKELDCHMMQGNLYSPALEIRDFEKLLDKH